MVDFDFVIPLSARFYLAMWKLELDRVRVQCNRESGYLAIFDVYGGSFVVCM